MKENIINKPAILENRLHGKPDFLGLIRRLNDSLKAHNEKYHRKVSGLIQDDVKRTMYDLVKDIFKLTEYFYSGLWITAWDRLQIFAVIQIENCEKYVI